jgi:heptosyltransferase-3
MAPAEAAVPPPVVLRFGAFGDMILLAPLLRVLQARYGQPCDLVSSGPWTAPLMQAIGCTRELHLLDSRRAPYWFNRSQRALVSWLRERPLGPVYIVDGDDKSHWLVARAGVPPKWICTLRDYPRQGGEHIVDYYHRLASATPRALSLHAPQPAPAMPPPISLDPGEQARRDCEEWLRARGLAGAPLVLVQPGNKRTMRRGARQRGSNVKYWPEQNWAEVVRGVVEQKPQARVLICGSAEEEALARDIQRLAGTDKAVAIAGELPIPRLLALLQRADSMISVDTGPAHAAAASGCPLAVLFAHRNPSYYAPRPSTAEVQILMPDAGYEADAYPMRSISPALVIERWSGLAGRSSEQRVGP